MPPQVRVRRAISKTSCPVCHTAIQPGEKILPHFKSRTHAHLACIAKKETP